MSQTLPPLTLRAWLLHAARLLREAGVPSPEADARALVLHTLGLNASALLTRGGEVVPGAEGERLAEVVGRRAARVPLQHLLGEVEWGGVRLKTDARALVPRPETEWLLHLALEALRSTPAPRVLDVGTGTGTLFGSAVANVGAGGNWSISSPTALAEGTYTVQAVQTDSAGNTGTSAAHTFVVDTTAPAVALTTPADGDVLGDNTPDIGGTGGTGAAG